jgi:hypothetical protein
MIKRSAERLSNRATGLSTTDGSLAPANIVRYSLAPGLRETPESFKACKFLDAPTQVYCCFKMAKQLIPLQLKNSPLITTYAVLKGL